MKNQIQECDIVLELLPLYIEHKTGDESNTFVSKHLAECGICNETYRLMSGDLLSEELGEEQRNVENCICTNLSCSIIQDLLISYCDCLTAKPVTEWLQGHLEECMDCQKKYQQLLKQRELEEWQEFDRGKRFVQKLKSMKYYMVGGVIGVFIPIAVVVIWWLIVCLKSYIETMFCCYFL